MEKIATATYSFEKLRRAGYVYVDKTVMVRTAVVRTAAVSAAGAGQGDGHVTMPAAEKQPNGVRQPKAAAVRRRRRRYGIGQYGARSDFSEAN